MVSLTGENLDFDNSIKAYVAIKYFSGDFKKLFSTRWACFLCLTISAFHIGAINTEMFDIRRRVGLEYSSPHDLVIEILQAKRIYPKIEQEMKIVSGRR